MALFIVILLFLLMAAGFAWFLVRHDRGEHEPVAALWTAFGLGALGIVIAGALEYFFVPDVFSHPGELGLLAGAALGIGIIEELSKSLLLIRYLRGKRYFNEHTDGIIYFALAGLGFGLPENILYTFQYGASVGLARIVLTPLFHAATTGIIGYAVARVRVGGRPNKRIFWTILAVIAAHAFYDFGLFSQLPLLALLSVMTTIGLGVALFLLFRRARRLDQALGLSAVGHNNFCRSCGHPNPKHNLYCSRCGNRA